MDFQYKPKQALKIEWDTYFYNKLRRNKLTK